MNQKIVCQRGTCIEADTIETELDSIFEETNIVHQIEKQMLKRMVR